MLLYNIWLEVAALGFNALIWIFYKFQYHSKNEINQRFETLTCTIFFLTFTDIVSAIGISYSDTVPFWANYLLNGANYILVGGSVYAFIRYIRTLVEKQNTGFAKFERLATIIFVISEIINPFFGFYFSFDQNGYVHGPVYTLQLLFAYSFVVDTAVLLIKYHNRLSIRKIVGTGGYVIMMLVTVALQIFLIPDFLLSGFTSTLTLFIIYLLMETPDYYKLMETMQELEKARTEANLANEAKSKFLANMSHEIRTPLNAVLGMDEMILRECADSDILDYAKNIKSSGNALLKIINDILDFSKIESGMLTINPGNYDLLATIDNIDQMFKMKAREKGLDFNLNIDPTLPKVLCGDEMRITQIIINLVNNAIKYTESGSVDFVVQRKPAKADKSVILCILVKDTGRGIKEEDKAKLFEEFERLDLEKSKNVEGTGLGLAITQSLTHQMGGTISVESTYGRGSTFTVELPQLVINAEPIGNRDKKLSSNEVKKYSEKFIAPSAKILAVDDNKVNLVVLCNLLKRTQVQITKATGGKEALQLLAKEKYDIVLLDHMMPEMDGIETLHEARKIDRETGNNPVYIVLTANAIAGVDEMYLSEGFEAYLSKPVDAVKLEETIYEFLPEEKKEIKN